MNPSFDIVSLVPSEDSQCLMLREFQDAPTANARDRALAAICTAFDPYVRQIARTHWRRSRRVNHGAGLADIEGAGKLGLLTALRRWRQQLGKSFIHFASRWISGSCKSAARQLSHGAVLLPLKVYRLRREYRTMNGVKQRETLLHRSRSRNSTLHIVRYLAQSESAYPVNLKSEHPDSSTAEILHADEPTAATQAETSEQVERMRLVLLNRCSARERLIFFINFPDWPLAEHEVGEVADKCGNPIELTEIKTIAHSGNKAAIGRLLKITRERVRQISHETLQKLRAALGEQRSNYIGKSGVHRREPMRTSLSPFTTVLPH